MSPESRPVFLTRQLTPKAKSTGRNRIVMPELCNPRLTWGLTLTAALCLTAPQVSASTVLTVGAKGSEVARIQQQLVDLGYHPGPVTGGFTEQTRQAVEVFQRAHHLSDHGGVGPRTQSLLAAAIAARYRPAAGKLGRIILQPGQFGKPVAVLQQDLQTLGYPVGGIDGVFNRPTERAVVSFQQRAHLNVTGQAGKVTVQAIRAALSRSAPAPPRFVLGFYTQYSPSSTASQNSLAAHVHQISAISPLWYSFRADGSLHALGYHYASVCRYAAAHHVAVYPVVINGFSNQQVVENPAIRQQVVTQLRGLALQDGYAGYNIDFEGLNPSARQGMNALVIALARALKPIGREIVVDVPPKTTPNNQYAMPYDFGVLGRYANQIVLMTYDYHSVGTPPGPVAPFPWMVASVRYALSRMPAKKIVLGLAAYGYDWSSTGHTTEYHDRAVEALARREGVRVRWNAVNREFTFQYVQQGIRHVVWFENGFSDRFRLQLARQDHLGGVALWRLGDENPRFWQSVRQTGW